MLHSPVPCDFDFNSSLILLLAVADRDQRQSFGAWPLMSGAGPLHESEPSSQTPFGDFGFFPIDLSERGYPALGDCRDSADAEGTWCRAERA